MTESAGSDSWIERVFNVSARGSTIKTEVLAGVTTFLTMAYILVVNPMILSDAGMDYGAVFTATALASVAATLVMAFLAKLPFALAPGMGLNAFFAYSVVLAMGHSWQFALTAVFIEGIIFLILTFFNVREAVLNAMPMNIKRAISGGIGLFIAFIGLVNAQVVIKPDGPLPVGLGEVTTGPALLAVIGLIVTGILVSKKTRGALIIGILFGTVFGIPLGVTQVPDQFALIGAPNAPAFLQFEFAQILSWDMVIVVLTFLFVDLFDTVGTLIGVSTKAKLLDREGRLPQAKPALFADAVGTTVGACLGTSTVTTYVESAAGVEEGGRTGLTALTVAALFAISLLFAPLFAIIPGAATAPALVLVGLFMMTPILEIDFGDYTESLPAFLCIIMMPLTYSISEGIVFGVISYALLKLLTGRGKEVHAVTYAVAAIFVASLFLK